MATRSDDDVAPVQDNERHAAPVDAHPDEAKSASSVSRFTTSVRLKSLYPLNARNKHDTLLLNLTRVAAPAVQCQIDRDGVLLPSLDDGTDEPGYRLFCTYSKLLLAPVLRIECRFSPDFETTPKPYLTLILDFHFCNFANDSGRITDYSQSSGRLSFTTTNATCAGFGNVGGVEHRFGESEREIVSVLKGYLDAGPAKQVVLKLHDHELKEEQLRAVEDVRGHLPGGQKALLPSIAHRTETQAVAFDPRPYTTQLRGEQPELVEVSLDCFDFFTTVDEACTQLWHSASVHHAEEYEALRLWSSVAHSASLHKCGGQHVLAVMFGDHPTLGNDKSKLRLPKSLEVKVTWGVPRALVRATGWLLPDNPGLPHHHAFFRISPGQDLEDFISKQGRTPRKFMVRLDPHENKFAANAHRATVMDLQHARQFHELLLNQRHDKIQSYDTTAKADLPPADRQALDTALRTCKPWSAEQLQVIDSVTSAKGKFSVVLGTAGTGKTTLHKALGLYYFCLGYHVLSLGPANADANHIAAELTPEELHREFPNWDLSCFGFDGQYLRLFAGSKDINIKNMTEHQAEHNQVGHEDGGITSLRELVIALEEEEKVKGSVKEYGILQALIRTADEGVFPDKSLATGEHWADMKTLIDEYRNGRMCLDDDAKYTFMSCKGDIVKRNRFMITTTGNIRSTEMVGNSNLPGRRGMEIDGSWFVRTEGVPHKGVVVLIDEATSDWELNLWSGIVCDSWTNAIQGVFLFGDDKQFRPPNKSADREIQYNCYLERLNISLPSRLKREGWPVIELKEQYRMHQCIADFPNRMVYNGQLRDGPITMRTLDAAKPGLRAVLTDIITEHGIRDDNERAQYRLEGSDAKARLHWIEVTGMRVKEMGSAAIQEHSDVVIDQIVPKLIEYFKSRGEKVADEVMILCAYSHAVNLYKEKIRRFRQDNPDFDRDDDVPRVVSVDSSMGKEACMVIFDGSVQHGDEVGFLAEDARVNVAITRSREVLWIVGGKMNLKYTNRKKPKNLIKLYKDELDSKGHSHLFMTAKQKNDVDASGGNEDDDAPAGDEGKGEGDKRGGRSGRGGRRGRGGDRGGRGGNRGRGGQQGNVRKCFTCGDEGHLQRDCPQRKCHKCNEVGHIAIACVVPYPVEEESFD